MTDPCQTRKRLVGLFAVVAAAAACGTIITLDGETPDSTPAAIDVESVGGIAALRMVTHVDSASGAFRYVVTHICPAGALCALVYQREGVLPPSAVAGLFARAALPEFRALRADYGVTRNGADMMGHDLTIRANGRRRSIVADDGTMPTLMAQFVHDVAGLVVPTG